MAVQIISETPISAFELKEALEKIKKKDNELNFRSAKTYEHLASIGTQKNSGSLLDKIAKMDVPRLKENHIRKIFDIMPASVKDLKVVLQGYNVSISNENMKKIVDAVVEASK